MRQDDPETTGPDTILPLLREATRGEYVVERELGRGGMAAVYLATDVALDRKVAIKTMLPELATKPTMLQRFKREAQLAAGLSHPHIIQIYTVKETGRLAFFVMKFIEGRSLDEILADRGHLDVDTTRLILQQAGSALAFAHHRGVIHRDIKPANVMIDENGWAVVTDFGIAKLGEASSLTATGTAMGTPHYMSPEQFHNKPATGASDQYSLGIVAYEMLSGRKPFDGGSFAEIITKHLFDAPPDIRADRPDLPAPVAAAITRMLAKEPAERFPDLDAAIAAIGHPTPERLDTVRAGLLSLARSGEPRQPRLSVPLSPVPSTRPGAQPTVVVGQKKQAAATRVAAKSRGRVLWWASAAVFVLAASGFLALGGDLPKKGTTSESLDAGVRLYQQGSAAAAQIEFSRAAMELPSSAVPHVYLSRLARENGNLPLARDEAAAALKLEPQNALAMREMGSVMLAMGNYDVARRFFVRAIRVDPDDRASMGWLGCALHRSGASDQARRWLDRAGAGAWNECAR